MWFRNFKDYPLDKPMKKKPVSSGKGIIGCEMKETFGWSEASHVSRGKSFVIPKRQSNLKNTREESDVKK